MEKKKLALLTSGGDAPGMNAAIRSVVRTAVANDFDVFGIKRGYTGIFEEDIISMNKSSVANCIYRGGTILYTSRCPEMMTDEGVSKASEILKKHEFTNLVVIGGDGSLRGAYALSKHGINVMVVPATIDMDMGCTNYTIGFDTAIDTVMQAVDRIKDTCNSHIRCSVVEVMGRRTGYIALWTGVATGAEEILIPDIWDGSIENIAKHIKEQMSRGKKHFIIINSEGIGHSEKLAAQIEEATGIETRATVLGYMQRGGMATCKDRFYASIMGNKAVEKLVEGERNKVIVYSGGEFVSMSIDKAVTAKKEFPTEYMNLFRTFDR